MGEEGNFTRFYHFPAGVIRGPWCLHRGGERAQNLGFLGANTWGGGVALSALGGPHPDSWDLSLCIKKNLRFTFL